MQLNMLKCFQPIIVIVAALRLKEVTGFQSGFGLAFFPLGEQSKCKFYT